ncbi:MAG: LysR family transcriptional regulator [Alphaproteobacteria bacterium]|nr:LysR family transcriptional regulator [Alphaproteobacteria bacterium]
MDALARLDLNLLRTLDVLLETRSVTAAASRLDRSQPAVSHALARLRDAFGDPLLVREGSGLTPTPRALELEPGLRVLLQELRTLVGGGASFDPATSRRELVLSCPDALAPILPDVLQSVADAPGISIEIRADRGLEALEHAHLLLDVLPDDAPGVHARVLGRTRDVVAMRRGHPVLDAPWTVEAWLAWPHVQVRLGGGGPSLVERALAERGLARTVGYTVPNLLLAPHLVARTNAFFTGAVQILAPLADSLGLELREPPIPVPGIRAGALWRARYHDDPAHRWFRERVISTLVRRFDEILAGWDGR